MLAFAAAGAFLGRIPAWVWVALALLAGGWYYGHARFEAGQADVKSEWDASVERGKKEVERLRSEAGKITVKVETEYVERIKEVKVSGETIVTQVPVYISRDLPELPGAWRVLHDGAAEGAIPVASQFSNAAPVAPADAAATVAANYSTCLANAEQLKGLQEWVTEQHKLNPGE